MTNTQAPALCGCQALVTIVTFEGEGKAKTERQVLLYKGKQHETQLEWEDMTTLAGTCMT